MIIRGELAAGDRLPKEADLAARLRLSRNSLREAVRALTLARILEARQGDGTYVTSLEPSMLLEPLTFMAEFHQDRTLLHVLEVRRILEAAAAALAAQYITDEELAELRRVVDEMDACETVEAFVANDLKFHRLIGAASRNPVLASVLDSFSTPMSRARVWRGVTQANAIAQTKAQHAALYDALAHHRPDIARAVATAHIAGVEAWLEARSAAPSQMPSPPSTIGLSRSARIGGAYSPGRKRARSSASTAAKRSARSGSAASTRSRELLEARRAHRHLVLDAAHALEAGGTGDRRLRERAHLGLVVDGRISSKKSPSAAARRRRRASRTTRRSSRNAASGSGTWCRLRMSDATSTEASSSGSASAPPSR